MNLLAFDPQGQVKLQGRWHDKAYRRGAPTINDVVLTAVCPHNDDYVDNVLPIKQARHAPKREGMRLPARRRDADPTALPAARSSRPSSGSTEHSAIALAVERG